MFTLESDGNHFLCDGCVHLKEHLLQSQESLKGISIFISEEKKNPPPFVTQSVNSHYWCGTGFMRSSNNYFPPRSFANWFPLGLFAFPKRVVWLVARCAPEKRILNLNFKVDLRRLRIDNAQSFSPPPPAAWENQRTIPVEILFQFCQFSIRFE